MSEKYNGPLHDELKEPYPGLRPFLDHEHDLLMGRKEQILQVIERLRETHFVAIIGGSGSGKSSLIRAGVVPQLRAYAIPDAGDYWVPVVFTPGTTKAERKPFEPIAPDAPDAPDAPEEQTPVTRLAWKFAQVMRPLKDGKVDLALRDEVAAYLRQEAGLSRLVNAYHELLPRPGPRTEKARFLFVIDQFEELFHPNNRDDPDTRLIIEAVIEHFQNPDPRAYVVMTMRSEHLADCAAFLNLPDAINRSFYLVRRLSNSELREVITEPAQVMQRLVQRQSPQRTAPVLFQPPVVARLLADVRRIEDDPDHLPLLQHLLARVWLAALARERRPPIGDVPAAVTMADLEAAVAPWPADAAPGWLAGDRKLNALRSCLENWAEHIYLRKRNAGQQARIDELLGKLAYKDPNNGLYFQQRVNVDDPHLLRGIDAPRPVLWDLLTDGFVDEVNYLFWDRENSDHVTLKVSHEAFIRGWPRLRRVADREAERFEEFVAVLRRCAAWQDGGTDEVLLLEAAEIERINRDGLLPVFDDEHQRKEWFAVLKLYREGDRLVKLENIVQPFIERSMARQQRLHDNATAQALAFKVAEDAARNAEEEKRIATARHQAESAAAQAVQRQTEAEAALIKAEAERNQARADQQVAEAQRAQIEAEAHRAKAEAEGTQARADEAAADAKQLQSAAETARANADTATARAEARRLRTKTWATLIFACFFVPIAAQSLLYFQPAITSTGQFVQVQRDVQSRRTKSELSSTEHAAVKDLETLAMAAGNTLKIQAGQPWLSWVWTAGALRELSFGIPLLGADFLQRLVDGASSEPLVNGEMRRLLTTAVWDGGANDGRPTKTLIGKEEETCSVVTPGSVEAEPVKGRFFPALHPGLGLFVRNVDASINEAAVFSAQLNVGDQACTGRFAFSAPASIMPTFFFDADLSVMAVVAVGNVPTLYDVEWNWDSIEATMMARLAPRRVLTDPRSKKAFEEKAKERVTNKPPNPAEVLETRPLPGGFEVNLGNVWWRLLTAEARRLPVSAPISEEVWQPLADGKGSRCEVLKGWLGAQAKQIQGTADTDPPKPDINVEVMATKDGRQCIALRRFGSSGGPNKPIAVGVQNSSALPSEVISIAVYHAVAVEAAMQEGQGDQTYPPQPFANWRFDIQVPGTLRDWWVGKPGTDWDGWLAATPKGSTSDAVASPYSTAALKRLADGIVATWSKRETQPNVRPAGQPNTKP